MSGALDMSLDDVISQNRKQRGNNRDRRSFRGGINKNRSLPYSNRPQRTEAPGKHAPGNSLLVQNLHYNVTEKDLYDLFGQIGPLNRAFLHIAPNGRSAGVADIVFKRSNDAERARNTYNNVELDGRPMRITTASVTTTVSSLTNRHHAPHDNRRDNNRNYSRGGRGGRGDRNGRSTRRPEPTQSDLDADMDSYMGSADN